MPLMYVQEFSGRIRKKLLVVIASGGETRRNLG